MHGALCAVVKCDGRLTVGQVFGIGDPAAVSGPIDPELLQFRVIKPKLLINIRPLRLLRQTA